MQLDKHFEIHQPKGTWSAKTITLEHYSGKIDGYLGINFNNHDAQGDNYFAGLEHQYAIALRDALIEAYPLPKPPEANPESFESFGKKVDAYWEGYDAGKASQLADDNKWQEVSVDPKGAGHTYRLRVPGGWLYRTVTYRFPEMHASFERDLETEYWDISDLRRGQEIAQQTTTFVPKA